MFEQTICLPVRWKLIEKIKRTKYYALFKKKHYCINSVIVYLNIST